MRDRKEIEREIKFRAWDKDRKMMMDDVSTWTDDYTSMLNRTIEYLQDEELADESVTLMQYTGLKDKNGVEVYEGDVLENDDYTGEVVYDKEEARFVLQSYTDGSNGMIAGVKTYSPIEGEIVGNRFENPDLLNTK